MKRLPLLPTLFVIAAVAAMIGLGVWQLERLQWKRDLLARYAAAQGLAPIPFPAGPDPKNPPLFRRSSALCLGVAGWRAESGRNLKDEPGWVHIAACRTGAEGPGFQAVMGWSAKPDRPDWKGGPVAGVIGSDREHVIRLIAADPAPGLQPAKPPSLDDVPNNHLFYAIQWFFFAGAALVIYILALRKRSG
ncbi:MAG TPA: SURF1 family protein [Sphingomonas sp.]|nr:SURF1 family protein [Sphingomonas sp.]